MPTSRESYCSAEKVARYLAVSERTVSRMVERGVIPSYEVLGQRRFRLADIDREVQRTKTWKPGIQPSNPKVAGSNPAGRAM